MFVLRIASPPVTNNGNMPLVVTNALLTNKDEELENVHTPSESYSRSSAAGAVGLAVTPRLLDLGALYVLHVRLDHLGRQGRRLVRISRTKMLKHLTGLH